MVNIITLDDLEILVEGSAKCIQTEQATWFYPGAWETKWTKDPFIVEVYHKDGFPVSLTDAEKEAILKFVDITNFVD